MIGFCAVQAGAFGPIKRSSRSFSAPTADDKMEVIGIPCFAAQPVSFSYILSSDFFGIMAVQSPKPVNTPVRLLFLHWPKMRSAEAFARFSHPLQCQSL
jgi:hypothetical protein